MASLDDLQASYSAVNGVRIESGLGGLTRVTVRTPACEADVYLHGAHVTHFQPAGHHPVLFLSANSEFIAAKPIRGGVPVIFPWFGPHSSDAHAPMHGLARLREWDVENVRSDGENVTLILRLASDGAPNGWPELCSLRYEITMGSSLRLALRVENGAADTLLFEEALHTYFAVGDARQIEIEGLRDTIFLDKTDNFAQKTQLERQLRLEAETDRVYTETAATCIIHDEANARRIVVAKQNSNNTVVWNPWIAKAAAMTDFGDNEWPSMVCVETCNVGAGAVQLAPGAAHEMTAHISIETV